VEAAVRYERDAERWFEEHGRRQRVFCASLADVFEQRPELEPWRVELFDLIARTPSLDWLILTKRPEIARDWRFAYDQVAEGPLVTRDLSPWGCPPNLWIGTSIENARHTYGADVLREIPATVRFISAEPLLGSLLEASGRRTRLDLEGIDWLIAGGESGIHYRPVNVEWIRQLRDLCQAQRVSEYAVEWDCNFAREWPLPEITLTEIATDFALTLRTVYGLHPLSDLDVTLIRYPDDGGSGSTSEPIAERMPVGSSDQRQAVNAPISASGRGKPGDRRRSKEAHP
jgi:protein gp37